MDIRPLHTEDDYRAALAEVSALVDRDPERGTPEGDRLEILSILVEDYERPTETALLLRSRANAAHLERSIAQLRTGDATGLRFGLMKGKITITDDFNAPLDPLTFTDHTQGKPMTVAELIAELDRHPPDARVVVRHFNSGFDDVCRVHTLPIKLGTAHFGNGAHDGPDIFSETPFEPDETAVVLDIEGEHTEAATAAEPVPVREAFLRLIHGEPLVELTDGTRTISVGISGLAQFGERFVRAWSGEHVGEVVTFATEAQARQALGPDLSAPETFEWVRQFMDDEIPYERFIAGRDAMR
jgi:hypothetical protein